MSQALLYGIHDREGRHLVPPGGWCVDTRALSELHPPTDYAALRGDINWIVRLNHGYGSTGTIPLPDQYQQFAAACANYVAKSRGAQRWIIGNEPNHQQERPNGVYITPADYARCFALCRDAIKRYVPDAQVIPAAVAPYHADPMPWVDYLTEMLHLIAESGGCDGLAIHTYTRSSDPADIESGALMGPPLQSTYSGFMSYLDALDCVPPSMFRLPVYITEFNELLPGGWHDANTGVVQAAYADIDDTNHSGTNYLPIMCLCLYRWPKYDQWFIEGKQGVIEDFKEAVGRGYASPVRETNAVTPTLHIPVVSPGTVPAPAPDLPARNWDERLTQRGVKVETPPLAPGQQFWRVVKARWFSEAEAGGRRHIYVGAPAGTPFRVDWPSGNAHGAANGRGGFDAGNFPMSPSLNEFSVRIDDGTPSETVKGIGMGADGNPGIHTATEVVFELATMPTKTHLPSVGTGTQEPQTARGIIDPRVAQAILQVESGGRTHGEDGKPIIRFEAHIFKTYLGNDALWARHFRTDAARPWVDQMWRRSEGDPWRVLHTGKQADEWDAFRFATNLAPGDAAYKAISVGAAQIMGFNHARIGYPTARAMFEAFANAPMQTLGFINFCLSDPELLAAIQRKDWRTIAKLYNGTGAVDTYAPLLEQAYGEVAT